MCTVKEGQISAGKSDPDMAQSIISLCNLTWRRERRIGVLHRSLVSHLSVWDCVPEHVIDSQLKDAVLWRPDSDYEYLLWLTLASSSISQNSATISSTMQSLVRQSSEVFAG